MRFLVKFIIFLVILGALVFGGALYAVSKIDISKYKEPLINKISEATGRELKIDGEIAFDVGLKTSIVANKVSFENADWSDKPQMLSVGKLEAQLKIIPLLMKRLEVEKVIAHDVTLVLEKTDQGANWNFTENRKEADSETQTAKTKTAETKTEADIKGIEVPATAEEPSNGRVADFGIYVKNVDVKNLQVSYSDMEQSHIVKVDSLELAAQNSSSPVSFELKSTYDGEILGAKRHIPIDIEGEIGSLNKIVKRKSGEFPLKIRGNISNMELNADGVIDNINQPAKGIDLKINAKGDDIAELIKIAMPQYSNVSDLGQYNVEAKIKGNDEKLVISDINANVGDDNRLGLHITGRIGNALAHPKDIKANAIVKVDNIKDITEQFTGKRIGFPKSNINMDITDAENLYNFDIKGQIGHSPFTITKSVDLSGARPFVKAQVSSTVFDLDEIVTAMKVEEDDENKDKSSGKKSGSSPSGALKNSVTGAVKSVTDTAANDNKPQNEKIFSDAPLPFDMLTKFNADMKRRIDKLILPKGIEINHFYTNAELKNGRLNGNIDKAKIAGGELNADVRLKVNDDSSANISVKLDGKDIALAEIINKIKKKDTVSGGVSSINTNLSGTGKSLHDIMSSLQGDFLLNTGGAKIKGEILNTLGGDAITNILSTINPARDDSKKADMTPLNCAVFNFDIEDGIAKSNKGIALQTNKVNIVAEGAIDLGKEKLSIFINPMPRSGIEIGVGSIIGQLLQIEGTLANPSVGINKAGTAKTAATIGAALATGGLSYLGQKLASKVTQDDNPCETALKANE